MTAGWRCAVEPDVTALERYLPLIQLAAFLACWGLAMITGLMFRAAS